MLNNRVAATDFEVAICVPRVKIFFKSRKQNDRLSK